jgi:hypothetical protein
VCRLHYVEYLVGLIGRHKLDPVTILDLVEVGQELRRRGKELPERSASCNDQEYRLICVKVGLVGGGLVHVATRVTGALVPNHLRGLLAELVCQCAQLHVCLSLLY